ncbi:hypothetical protein F528_1148, partial [Neisseria meningitidis 992008]
KSPPTASPFQKMPSETEKCVSDGIFSVNTNPECV